jgi:hypothetical protein
LSVCYNDTDDAQRNLDGSLRQMCRTLTSLNPENIFLPLSGGMDSRLLAFGLARSPDLRRKVRAYSYGRSRDGKEAIISKKVADALGLSWEFIEYSDNQWRLMRANIDETFANFDLVSSFPNLQEALASKFVYKKYGCGIFVPGYCLDALAGKHIYTESMYQKNYLSDVISDSRYQLDDKAANYEYVFLLHRMSKNVVPSVANFRFEGCDFVLPFWFNHVYDFWYSLPYKVREQRALFSKTVERMYNEEYPGLNKIEYANQAIGASSIISNIKNKMFLTVHNVYSISFIRNIFRRVLYKKIISSNKEMDYLGVYNFCAEDKFSQELETEHYHNRVAEIAYRYLNKEL